MKKAVYLFAKKMVSLMLVGSLIVSISSVVSAEGIEQNPTSNTSVSTELNATGKFIMNTVSNPVISTVGGEWSIIGLARSGVSVPDSYYSKYYVNVVNELIEKEGNLTRNKYSEYSRLILALTSIGYDVKNVGGYNLLEKLADFNSIIKQGINGPIFALIALDSKNYEIPVVEGITVQTTREILIDYILKKEIVDGDGVKGGFALTGNIPDPDITGMALQALARYKNQPEVKASIDRSLAVINQMELSDGSFATWGAENSESIVQIIIAKTALGINPEKNVTALNKYYIEGGSFGHILKEGTNIMATEQGLYALAAYDRFINNEKPLYDMTDVIYQNGHEIKVTLNGKYLKFDAAPVNIQGRVLVPMRAIFEAMGADVGWDQSLMKVTGTLGTKTVELTIGNNKAYVNETEVALEVPATLINDRTMVPVRFISESLDAYVDWNQENKTVIIVK